MTTIDYSEYKARDVLAPLDALEISYHENKVPLFVEDELIRLYFHINSSLDYLKKKFEDESISTYIAYKNNSITSIFLLIINKKRMIVINEMIKIPEEELVRFANYIFLSMKNIDIISFSLIHKQSYQIPFPAQQFDSSEDVILTLPSTPTIYLQSLSAKTRRNIRYQLKKILHDFPSFEYQTYECSQVSEDHINDLIGLNKSRIAEKK